MYITTGVLPDMLEIVKCRQHLIRQLPMGAGLCPWGGYTDEIVWRYRLTLINRLTDF